MNSRNKFTVSRVVRPFVAFKHSYYSVSSSMVDGRSVNVSNMSVDDPSTRFDGLHALDFCLQNLLANNVDLKSMSLTDDLFVGHDKCLEFCSSITNPKSNSIDEKA